MSARMAKSVWNRLVSFVETIAPDCSLPASKFLINALAGLLIASDSKLSNWGRAMWSDGKLIHREKYFSRWMGSKRVDDEKLRAAYLKQAAPHITSQHVIAFDTSDISKPRVRKMPYLSGVHDGSEGTTGIGWPLVAVEAVAEVSRIPLCLRIYSHRDPEFVSEHRTHRDAIREVAPHVPDDCIWAFDRGFDDRKFFKLAADEGIQFVVRVGSRRHLFLRGSNKRVTTKTIGNWIQLSHVFKLKKYIRDDSPLGLVRVGYTRVRLTEYSKSNVSRSRPGGPEYIAVVVLRPDAPRPLVMLTNAKIRGDVALERLVTAYAWRWGIEEAFRYEKQLFNLEDFRVLRWFAMKRMICLVFLAYGFEALFAATDPRTVNFIIERAARAFGETPRYLFYRLQDALRVLLIVHLWTTNPIRGPPS